MFYAGIVLQGGLLYARPKLPMLGLKNPGHRFGFKGSDLFLKCLNLLGQGDEGTEEVFAIDFNGVGSEWIAEECEEID